MSGRWGRSTAVSCLAASAVIVAVSGGTAADAATGTWTTTLAKMPASVLDSGSAVLGGLLYSVDGKIPNATTKQQWVTTVYAYNPVANTWAKLANTPGAAVEDPAVAAYNGLLYAFGGATGSFTGATTQAFSYNPATNTWTKLAAMPVARGEARAEVINGLIYVAGGLSPTSVSLSSMSVYNPATNTWSTGPSMPSPRDSYGAAVLNGLLYVVGGRNEASKSKVINGTLATMVVFDPATGIWSAGPSMPTGRRTMAVGTLNGMLQVAGGEITSSGGTFTQNEQFDPTTQTWSELTPMSFSTKGSAYGTIGTALYVAGGGHKGGTHFTNVTQSFIE